MKKTIALLLCLLSVSTAFFTACNDSDNTSSAADDKSTASSAASGAASSEAASSVASSAVETAALPDGVYTADFDTDSSMFHANEACNGKGTLTVENGQMTFHVSLASTHIVNLYLGKAADAAANASDWLQPTTDTVTYSDGTSEEVYGFDIWPCHRGEPRCPDRGRRQNDRCHRVEQPQL